MVSSYFPTLNQDLTGYPKWDFLPTPDTSKPHSVNRYDLVAPGAGFVWREEAYYYPDVTRPILFQSTQGWSVVNCSSYFAPDDPVRNGVGAHVLIYHLKVQKLILLVHVPPSCSPLLSQYQTRRLPTRQRQNWNHQGIEIPRVFFVGSI